MKSEPTTLHVEGGEAKQHYSLINATVTFDSGDGTMASDVQFMSVSDHQTFPVNRLTQLQNRAAFGVKQNIEKGLPQGQQLPKFEVMDVTFKSIIYLGHMTAVEFHGSVPDPASITPQ